MARFLKENRMEFADILKDVGDSGYYQNRLIYLFLVPAYTLFPFFSVPVIFLTSIPIHWCYVPEVAHSNLNISFQRAIVSPSSKSCFMYDVNYTSMALTGNWKINKSAPTKLCNNGWHYDKTHYDNTAVTRWNLVCKDSHYVPLILSNMFQGVLIGTPLFSALSWRYGRRVTFLASVALVAASDVGSTLVPVFFLCILLRIVEGMALATVYTSGYFIIMELVHPKLRVRVNEISTKCWCAGSCLVPFLAYATRSWVYLTSISSCSALLIFIIAFWILPESPSWLITRGRYKDVVDILHSMNKLNGLKIQNMTLLLYKVQIIGDIYKRETRPKPKLTIKTIFKYPLLRKRLILIVICWMCVSIPYFGLNMNTRNLDGNQFMNFLLAVGIETPIHFSSWILLTFTCRRITTLTGFSIAAFILFFPYPFRKYQRFNIIVTIIAKAGVSIAYNALYAFCPELPDLLPVPLKSLGIKLSFFAGTFAACFSSYIVFLNQFGGFVPFYVFGSLMVIAVLCALFLPETDGQKIPKTVEEAEEFEKNYNPCTCECINWRQIRRPNTDEPHSDHLHSDELHSENSYSDKSDSGKHTLASPPTIMFGQL